MLENEDQFVPRTVERAHTAVGLAPNAQILELRIDRLAGREHLAEMTPVHAHIVDRAIAAMLGKVSKRFPQKIRIGPLGHLARGHDELSMARLASAADVAADRHVVGRVGENQPGLLPAQQQLELCSEFPEPALGFLKLVTGDEPPLGSELAECLEQIRSAASQLENDPRFQRLRELLRTYEQELE